MIGGCRSVLIIDWRAHVFFFFIMLSPIPCISMKTIIAATQSSVKWLISFTFVVCENSKLSWWTDVNLVSSHFLQIKMNWILQSYRLTCFALETRRRWFWISATWSYGLSDSFTKAVGMLMEPPDGINLVYFMFVGLPMCYRFCHFIKSLRQNLCETRHHICDRNFRMLWEMMGIGLLPSWEE